MPIATADSKPTALDERSSSFNNDKDTSASEVDSSEAISESQFHTSGESSFQMAPNPGPESAILNGSSASSMAMTPMPDTAPKADIQVEEEAREEEAEEPELAESERGGGLPDLPPEDEDEGEQQQEEQAAETPRTPEEDPEFQAVVARVEQRASAQQAHRPAQTEVDSAQSAAPSPDNETESRARAMQVEEMDQQEPGTFNADAFKQLLLDQIAAILPTNEKDADKFSKDNRMDRVQNAASNQADQEKERAAGSIESSTQQEPDTSRVEERQPTELDEPETGPEPAYVAASQAMPNARPAAEVSTPLQENASEMDQHMQQAEVTEKQLAGSNEPQFTQALDKKKEAKQHSKQAPGQVRQQEQTILDNSQSQAQVAGQQQLEGMHAERSGLLGQVMGQQQELMSQNTAERQQVADHINKIYETTKIDVEEILSTLDEEVNRRFEQGAENAKSAFEDHVDREMKAYKKERYGEWFDVTGWGKRLGDAVTGLPDEVNEFFMEGRQIYINSMDVVLSDIADYVAKKLNEATRRINTGKQNVEKYVSSLRGNLQEAGKDAAEEIQGKFDELQQNVNSKQDELVNSLAQQYKDSLDAVDARIEEMKAANRGLVDAALSALTGVIETILRIKNMIGNLLSGAVAAVQAIIADPIGFLGNLIQGVKQGFTNFMSRILEHLQSGLIGWLTGALGPVGIQIPDDLFSLKGIFSLVMQVLGLTWDYVREKAVQLFGEPVVSALETGLKLFQILRNEGVAGLWEYVKEQFADLKETVIGAIKEMVITQVMQAGVKWVMGLLNPAGAFVKAAMLIIDIVRFFIERGSQIIELVNAITESIRAIATGNVGQVAAKIEDALKRALPVLIGFLASLLGISGLARKVQDLIKKIRKRIDKAITKVLMKAKKTAGKLLAKLGIGKDKTRPDPRTQQEKQQDVDDATEEANRYLDEEDANPDEIREKLSGLTTKYDLKEARLEQNPRNEKYYIKLKINPESKTDEEELNKSDEFKLSTGSKYLIYHSNTREWELGEVRKEDVIGEEKITFFEVLSGREKGSSFGLSNTKLKDDLGNKSYKLIQVYNNQAKGDPNGPYAHLTDPPNAGPYKEFTADQKAKIIQANIDKNGNLVSDESGVELVMAEMRRKGKSVNQNEVNIDHYWPRSEGGWNTYANARAISFAENLEKSAKIPI